MDLLKAQSSRKGLIFRSFSAFIFYLCSVEKNDDYLLKNYRPTHCILSFLYLQTMPNIKRVLIYVIPVTLFSFALNIPKFMEVSVMNNKTSSFLVNTIKNISSLFFKYINKHFIELHSISWCITFFEFDSYYVKGCQRAVKRLKYKSQGPGYPLSSSERGSSELCLLFQLINPEIHSVSFQ